MKKFNLEAMEAITDISDEELLIVTGAGKLGDSKSAFSGGVICTISHECQYNSVSPAAWCTCCS